MGLGWVVVIRDLEDVLAVVDILHAAGEGRLLPTAWGVSCMD